MSHLLNNLTLEHEKILNVLAALQNFVAFHAKQATTPRKPLGHFVLFFREYLDHWHHGKEEGLLFPAMVEAGLPAEAGPVGCMLREHDLGRGLLHGLAAFAEGSGGLTPAELGSLGSMAVEYARLLAIHIAKENQMLYPMARRIIPADRLGELDASAGALDARWGQQGVELARLGEALCTRFGGLDEAAREPREGPA